MAVAFFSHVFCACLLCFVHRQFLNQKSVTYFTEKISQLEMQLVMHTDSKLIVRQIMSELRGEEALDKDSVKNMVQK